ncbi:MAG: hypothetical protein WCW52_05900 [Elusimicrobiales bacterium]
MRKVIFTAVMLCLAGGAYAGEAMDSLTEAVVGTGTGKTEIAVPAPVGPALTDAQVKEQAYAKLAGLFEKGKTVSILENIGAACRSFGVDLITAVEKGGLEREGAALDFCEKDNSYHDLVPSAPVYDVYFKIGYDNSKSYWDYDVSGGKSITLANLIQQATVEVKRNGKYLILKTVISPTLSDSQDPVRTGYGLISQE